MDLPAELRNGIWSMLLVQHSPIEVSPVKPYVKEPALLAVGRQVRSETMSIWYAENAFRITGSSPAIRFLRSRSDQQLRSLRSLCVSTEKSTEIREAPKKWIQHVRSKVEIVMREFEGRGLQRKAIEFQVNVADQIEWLNGDELDDLVVTGEKGEKGKVTRAGTIASEERKPSRPTTVSS